MIQSISSNDLLAIANIILDGSTQISNDIITQEEPFTCDSTYSQFVSSPILKVKVDTYKHIKSLCHLQYTRRLTSIWNNNIKYIKEHPHEAHRKR